MVWEFEVIYKRDMEVNGVTLVPDGGVTGAGVFIDGKRSI